MRSGDYLIIGAGPAGLQLGYFFEESKRDYLILEAEDKVGKFFANFPKHRKLLSINKVFTGYTDKDINLRWDWNSLLCDSDHLLFKNYSKEYFPNADFLFKYLNDFANYYQLKIQYNSKVLKISKIKNKFHVVDRHGNIFVYEKLIIATGLNKEYIPPISGIELAESYGSFNMRLEKARNKKILIIGKGNSAFETAEYFIEEASHIHLTSPSKLKMAWDTHFPGNLRAVNNNIIDTYHLKSQNAVLNDSVKAIEKQGDGFVVTLIYSANGVEDKLSYDRVINCSGFTYDSTIFSEECRPHLIHNNRVPKQTCEWESTNIKGLYFCGTLMQARDYKKTNSSFIHGFRYNIRALNKIIGIKHHKQEWPCLHFRFDAEVLSKTLFKRINSSSGLWHQPGFLCDLVILSPRNDAIYYLEEVPVDYVHHHFSEQNFYTLTINYTSLPKDLPISEKESKIIFQQSERQFPHPILRKFIKGDLIKEYHVPEDLYADWSHVEGYYRPLFNFVHADLEKATIKSKEKLSQSVISKNNIFKDNKEIKKMDANLSLVENTSIRAKL